MSITYAMHPPHGNYTLPTVKNLTEVVEKKNVAILSIITLVA
jgi:hypothetical protein